MEKRKKRLAEYIIDDIKAMLKDGRLKEGDKLPNQNAFAKQLGVSRLSLREALQTLEMMGIVRQKPKIGTIIINGDTGQWEHPFRKIELKNEDDTRQMLLARSCVEPAVALEAAAHITSEQLEKLTQIYYEMYEAYRVSDVEGYLAKDKEFHLYIAGACRNQYLLSMNEIALSQVDSFMKDVFIALPEAFEKTVRMHRAIYEALAEHNLEKVKRSVKQHTAYIEELLSQFFRLNDGPNFTQQGSLYYP